MATLTQEQIDLLQAKLKTYAEQVAWSDVEDYNIGDRANHDFDNAYWGGVDAGEIMFARELLKQFFPTPKV